MADQDSFHHDAVTPLHRFTTSRFWRTLPAGMRRRWWMFRPLDLIARHWPVLKKRRGLLVVRMDGIGDMVLFRTCLDHYADVFGFDVADITVLGCTSWADVADIVFAGYRVRVIDEHAYARRPLYRFKISLWLRRLAPAVTVCDSYLRRALMADSLVWIAAAPRTLASLPYINEPTRAEFLYYLSQVDEIIHTGDYPTHEVIRHYRFLSVLSGRRIRPEPPRLPWHDEPPAIAGGGPYVVINTGSNEPGRRWPLGHYLKLAGRLLETGYRVVFVGKSEVKTEEGNFKHFRQRPGVIDLIGRTTLPGLLDLMNHAAAVLSNDSGPAHLSIALGVPTVVIVGGGHFGCFVPYPKQITPPKVRFVFHEMECYHCFWRCHKRISKYDVFPCISAVAEERVWGELQGVLPKLSVEALASP